MLSFTPAEAKHVAKLPKYKGQEYLMRKLLAHHTDEEAELRNELLCDYYYDALQFAVNRGFSWKEVVSCMNVADDLLKTSIGHGKTLTNAVKSLQNIVASYIHDGKLSMRNATLVIQYITKSFLAHFRLYSYVFTQSQENNSGTVNVLVECPPQLMKLAEADTLENWEYAKKMKKIDQEEERMKAELKNKQKGVEIRIENLDKDLKSKFLEGELKSISFNDAEKLLADMTSAIVTLDKEDIETRVIGLKDSADIALRRQSIPAPSEWKNSSLHLNKNARPKSPLDSRVSSGKSSSSKKKK